MAQPVRFRDGSPAEADFPPRLGEHGKAANGWAKAWMRNTDAKLTLADLVTRPPTWHDRPRVFQLPATAPT